MTAVAAYDDSDDPMPVDLPLQRQPFDAEVVRSRVVDRRPVVPPWLRSRSEFGALVVWLSRYGAHATGFHLARSPLYLARLGARAPGGGWRVARAVVWWVLDREQAPIREGAVQRGAVAEYLALSKLRRDRVKQRAILAAVVATALSIGSAVAVSLVPGWVSIACGVLAAAVLGVAGTPPDRRVISTATVTPFASPRLTSDVVTRALQSLGVAALSSKSASISYVAPITRDGPGWRADVDLPHGVTVADIMERRDRLASGLRRPLSSVWPEPSAEQHAGRLVLWVGDQPLNQVKPAAWPLLKSGRVDLLGGTFPFGVDQRQRPVMLGLAETNALIGSLPGGGKTSALRVLTLAAALDPLCELRIHEHKGTADLSALEKVAYRYGSGPDEQTIGETLASLREVYGELERRARVIGKLPRDLAPDSKVTPALAARRSLGLHPLVIAIDECQEVFSHQVHGKEAGELCTAIIKRGRALGVILLLATQRPDRDSLPTSISANVGVRFALRLMDQWTNDAVLGTSSYKAGIRATTLTPRDRGIGYLAGVADDPLVVRTYYVDRVAADRIAERAYAVRQAAGTLSGYCLGEQNEHLTPAASLLEDLAVVFAQAQVVKLSTERVLELLSELRPQVYGGWSPEALAAGVRPDQLGPTQVWIDGTNMRGYRLEHVSEALERRQIAV